MSDFIRIKTSSPAGDLISLLPSFRQLYRVSGKKIVIYQAIEVVGQGLNGYDQPFVNERGESIMMTYKTFQMLIPLLEAQDFIQNYYEFSGQEFEYDMDEIRLKTFTNQPLGSLHRWAWYVFPEMSCDLSEINIGLNWNDMRVDLFDKVIVNYTPRYRNNWISYYFLKEHEDKLIFAGLEKEHKEYCKKWNLDIPLLQINDFYELAIALNSCKLFMGNASMMFQIAEGLKIPRLLETFQIMPNVIPMGKNGYDAYHQTAIQFYFNKLIQ
jgi:hypothetical protein